MQNKEDMTTTTMYLTDHIIEEVQRKIRERLDWIGEKKIGTQEFVPLDLGDTPKVEEDLLSEDLLYLHRGSPWAAPCRCLGVAMVKLCHPPCFFSVQGLTPTLSFLTCFGNIFFPYFLLSTFVTWTLMRGRRLLADTSHVQQSPPPAFFLTPPPKFTLLLISLRCTPSKNSLKRSACDDIR